MEHNSLFDALARVEKQIIYTPSGDQMYVIERRAFEKLMAAIEANDVVDLTDTVQI
ncbi:hypothetical protein [Maritalea myrionectae]|uniref:Uncharacterized protein n=1 Tax=Maritalea myrionectae TaxID=454601 RepID=A0A2R4MCF9_9HYPH|nr:hypothetical protein [Maritalea myrionectae]AVX03721.1 hypothetical protein MXMO3_01190 [Maritalea myrionectae]